MINVGSARDGSDRRRVVTKHIVRAPRMGARRRVWRRSLSRVLGVLGVIVVLDLVLIFPTLLAAMVGWSLTEAVPTWGEITRMFTGERQLNGDWVWKLIVCAGWVAWAPVATATVVEAAALLRGRSSPRIPVLAPLQAIAASILDAAFVSRPSRPDQRVRVERRVPGEERRMRGPRGTPTRRTSLSDVAARQRQHVPLRVQHIVARFGGLAPSLRRRRAVSQPRRAEQRQHSGTATPPLHPLPEPTLDPTEGVDLALRRLGTALKHQRPSPVPLVAAVHGGYLEVLLDRHSAEAPSPWTSQASDQIWRAPLGSAGDGLDPESAQIASFVTLGVLGEGGILLNLDAVGAVGVVGEPATVVALTRSMLTELEVTRVAGVAVVHLVGDLDEVVPSVFEKVRHPDIAKALAAVEHLPAGIGGPSAATEVGGASEPRSRGFSSTGPVVVVVSGVDSTEEEAIERLVHRCREGCGVLAVFVNGCPAGALAIQVATDETVIPALGLRWPTERIEDRTARNAPTSEGAVPPAVALSDQESAAPSNPLMADEGGREDSADHRCFLHLLGSIAVEGVDVRPQQLAILAYLVLHGETTADALRDAVWGGKPPTRERFLNTMHELRRVVGADVLPSARDGRYRLCDVWSDLAEVERLVASASADPDTASADLRAVLELVRGPPISYESRHRRHFRWVDLGNHASHWERIVCDVAHRLASFALQADDLDLARWAAERGLMACPGSETLTADLVRAHLAAGDRKTAERVVGEYSRALEDGGDEAPPFALHELLGPTGGS